MTNRFSIPVSQPAATHAARSSPIALCLAFALLAGLLGGCATPQHPIVLATDYASLRGAKVGVAVSTLPKVTTSFPGADCLLCMAAASLSQRSMTTHIESLSSDDIKSLAPDIARRLRDKGIDVVLIETPLDLRSFANISSPPANTSKRDLRPLREQYHVDKLLLLEITSLGVVRNFSNYFPVTEPLAVFSGNGYLVNLSDNSLEWMLPAVVRKSAAGTWDQPPKYPGLTNAYFLAIEEGKDVLLHPFER